MSSIAAAPAISGSALAPPPLTAISPAASKGTTSTTSTNNAEAGPSQRARAEKRTATKTVAVFGASYGGARAARMLSQELPEGWRLVVIDRNSHMNHVYVFPRYTVLPKHAPKAYIPYINHLNPPPTPKSTPAQSTGLPTPPLTPTTSSASSASSSHEDELGLDLAPRHQWLQASITSLTSHSVTFTRPPPRRPTSGTATPATPSDASASASTSVEADREAAGSYEAQFGLFGGPEETIEFDYAVYALGAGLPDPVNVWKTPYGGATPEDAGLVQGSKRSGVRFMERKSESLKLAGRVLIVGGGALGIQFATDLKSVYPSKEVTLLHSRSRLMPLYPLEMHTTIVENLRALGITLVLGERVITFPDNPECLDGVEKTVTTDHGRTFTADLVLLCTGQKPHVAAMAALCPSTISPTSSRIRVRPTMQVSAGPLRPAATRANTLERLGAMSLHGLHTPPASDASGSGSGAAGDASEAGVGVGAEEDEDEHPDLSHIFAVGDCAETGAIQAGHTAYYQAEVAARNILRLVRAQDAREAREAGKRGKEEKVDTESEPELELENYKVSVPAIKVTLGLTRGVISNAEGTKVSDEGVEDLQAMVMWPSFQCEDMDVNA